MDQAALWGGLGLLVRAGSVDPSADLGQVDSLFGEHGHSKNSQRFPQALSSNLFSFIHTAAAAREKDTP
jgi:hypothetical protein